jgi:hypothetical protein
MKSTEHPRSPADRSRQGFVAASGRRWSTLTFIEEYVARLAIARERFDQHPAVRALFRDPIDPVTLEAFPIPAQGRVAFTDVSVPQLSTTGELRALVH